MKHAIKAARKGGRIEVTRTLTVELDDYAVEARKLALQREIHGYDLQISFLTERRDEAQDELNELLAIGGQKTDVPQVTDQ